MPAKSKAQQRFFGVVKGIQKGGKGTGKAKKAAKDMSPEDVDDFASTKHDGLPSRVKREQKVRRLIKKMVGEVFEELNSKVTEAKERNYKEEYKKYGSSTKAKKYRAELNAYNRKKGTYGNGDKKDASHKNGKIVGFEEESKNRGRAEKSRLKKEQRVRISTMKDANFTPGMVQLLGKKGKLGMDRKSVSALVKAVRSTLGRSFTTHEVKEEKLTEAKMVTLPNGVKVKIEFKGITLQAKGKKPVFLDRREMMVFFKATSKYMKVRNENVAPNHDGKAAPYGSGYKKTKKSKKESYISNGKLTESGKQIAATILQQLGGNKFIAMTGAKNLGFTNKGLQMKIGRNSKGVTHVIIDLDRGKDLYNIEFVKVRGMKRTTVKKLKGIYADQLRNIFTKYTGLRTSL